MEKKDINDVFKDSFDNFETKVKPSVWKNIKTGLRWGGVGLFVKFLLQKLGTNTVVGVLSSVATVISTVMVMNTINSDDDKNSSDVNTSSVTEPVEVLEKVAPVAVHEVVIEEEKIVEEKVVELPKSVPVAKVQPEKRKETKKQPSKVDKQKLESVIGSLSSQSVASISASPVGGSVPLIVSLENTGTGLSNKWSFTDGKNDNGGKNPIHVFEKPGTYSIYLRSVDEKGKVAVDSVRVEVTGNSSMSPIPTLFSPNGDGVADFFTFKSKNMVNMNVEIFDKSGTLFYTWIGHGGRWDGRTPKGKKAKDGTYFYFIEAEGVDGKKYQQKGAINLAR